tara:strand:+ start:2572 stop:3201 length:630 start_codon:yes stop_codon:yes gene_type:complete
METLNIKDVYENQFQNIAKYIKSLDLRAGFFRPEDDYKDLVHEFLTNIFEVKNRNNQSYRLIDSYDPQRCKSNNPQLKFLIGLLKNFYSAQRSKDLKRRNIIKNIHQEQLDNVTCFHNKSNRYDFYQDQLLQNNQEEGSNFCHDFKKLSRDFVKKLKGLELKAYKYLIDDQLTPRELALTLGVSKQTAYNLRKSINQKAQNIMEVYNVS